MEAGCREPSRPQVEADDDLDGGDEESDSQAHGPIIAERRAPWGERFAAEAHFSGDTRWSYGTDEWLR